MFFLALLINVADATDTLSQYARKGLREALVVTRRGKPLMALTPIRRLQAIIERSRASHKPGTGISTEEMRRRLGLKRRR
jgi:DNA-binding IclR family transcriptional regulator